MPPPQKVQEGLGTARRHGNAPLPFQLRALPPVPDVQQPERAVAPPGEHGLPPLLHLPHRGAVHKFQKTLPRDKTARNPQKAHIAPVKGHLILDAHPHRGIGDACGFQQFFGASVAFESVFRAGDSLIGVFFQIYFRQNDADMSVAAVPYVVKVPYGVFNLEGRNIKGVTEKPTISYYANAGIYLIKKERLELIPENEFFNATDFMDLLIKEGYKVIRYPISGYWIDIGQHDELERAREIAKHIGNL